MSVNTQALFAFNRPLPPPFNGLKSKKVKTSSTYGDGTESTSVSYTHLDVYKRQQ